MSVLRRVSVVVMVLGGLLAGAAPAAATDLAAPRVELSTAVNPAACSANPVRASWGVAFWDGQYRLSRVQFSGFSRDCVGGLLDAVLLRDSVVMGRVTTTVRGSTVTIGVRALNIPAADLNGVALALQTASNPVGAPPSVDDDGLVLDAVIDAPEPVDPPVPTDGGPDGTVPTEVPQLQQCHCINCSGDPTALAVPWAISGALAAALIGSWLWFFVVLRRRDDDAHTDSEAAGSAE